MGTYNNNNNNNNNDDDDDDDNVDDNVDDTCKSIFTDSYGIDTKSYRC